MPLSAEEAVTIARKHGLTMQDATALRSLTDDPDEADQLAAKFSAHTDPERAAQAVTDRRKGRA